MRSLQEARDALAGVEERQRELVERRLQVLVKEAHRLSSVEHRATPNSDDQVRSQAVEELRTGARHGLSKLRLDIAEHVNLRSREVPADLVHGTSSFRRAVGHNHRRTRL